MNDHSETYREPSPPVRWRLVAGILVLSTTVTFAWMLHQQAVEDWDRIPANDGTLQATEMRLAAVEAYLVRYPSWIGGRDALSEKTHLATRAAKLRTQQTLDAADAEAEHGMKVDAANTAQHRGEELAEAGDFKGALSELRKALELAPKDWAARERVRRDVAAFEEWLSNDRAAQDDRGSPR